VERLSLASVTLHWLERDIFVHFFQHALAELKRA
jgi:hypothetical protein